jgi:hypothetical protein
VTPEHSELPDYLPRSEPPKSCEEVQAIVEKIKERSTGGTATWQESAQ